MTGRAHGIAKLLDRILQCSHGKGRLQLIADLVAQVEELLGRESISELSVFLMNLAQDLDQMRLFEFALGAGLFHPLIAGLFRDTHYLARHCDRHPHWSNSCSNLLDAWEYYFGARYKLATDTRPPDAIPRSLAPGAHYV